jgi:hypothetical protein
MITLLPILLLALSPTEEPAPESEPEVAAESASDTSAVGLARALFERGLASYEAGDYGGAAAHWSSAYELMASDPSLVKSRRVLAFDLGQAHMRAYDVDGDRSRLGKARPLLEDYVAWVDRPGHTMSDDEREDRARAEEMLARIDILEGAPPSPRSVAAPTPPEDAPSRPPERRRTGTGFIVGGSVSLTLGVALAAGAITFAVRGREAERDFADAEMNLVSDPGNAEFINARDKAEFNGKQANAGIITMSTLSALMGVGGIAMIVTGAKMRQRARNLALAPAMAPGFAGAVVRGRF